MPQSKYVLEVEYELVCLTNGTFLHLLFYHILGSAFHCLLLRKTATSLCFRPPFKINLSCKDSLLQGK